MNLGTFEQKYGAHQFLPWVKHPGPRKEVVLANIPRRQPGGSSISVVFTVKACWEFFNMF
jgi:hypothetical protein